MLESGRSSMSSYSYRTEVDGVVPWSLIDTSSNYQIKKLPSNPPLYINLYLFECSSAEQPLVIRLWHLRESKSLKFSNFLI